jgi:hypothetical protein
MADEKKKTVGDRVIEIIHSIYHTPQRTGGETKDDPIPKVIDDLSENSIVGGKNRKKKIDKALEDAGG